MPGYLWLSQSSETMSDLRSPQNLDELVKQLHEALAGDTADIDHVQKLMESYSSNPEHWRSFTSFDKHK